MIEPTTLLLGAGALGVLALGRDSERRPPRRARDARRSLLDLARPLPASVRAVVSSGWNALRARGTRRHRSIDIPVPVGTPILAIDTGVVERVGHDPDRDAGLYVAIRHPSGVVSRYLHLSEIDVMRGQRVARGQRVGRSGNTGRSEGPHLHLDLTVPAALVRDVVRAVGRPRGGFGPATPAGFRVPAEPWIPVDGYRPGVRRAAAAAGIPLFTERSTS